MSKSKNKELTKIQEEANKSINIPAKFKSLQTNDYCKK